MKPPKPFEKKVIASPEDFYPTRKDFKVIGAFNPGVATVKTSRGLETILYVRVAETPSKRVPGNVLLPFFHIKNKEQAPPELDYDIVAKEKFKIITEKGVIPKEGHSRLRHISLPRMIVLDNYRNVSEITQEPAIYPTWEYERFGLEDVRITPFEDERYLIAYATPHREFGVRSPILVTKNLKDPKTLERVTSDNTPRPEINGKDVAPFPTKIPSPSETELIKKGQPIYASFTRSNAFPDISTPGIWISYSPDLVHWGQDHRLIISENGEITGTGSPPIKRPKGWVAAYHETTFTKSKSNSKGKTKYVTRLMTLDLKEPWKLNHKSPVLLKREDYYDILPENGFVQDTVFTTGMIVDEDRTDIISGIDDKWSVLDSFYTQDIDRFAQAA